MSEQAPIELGHRFTWVPHLLIDFDVEPDQLVLAVACDLVLHAGVTFASALHLVKEVCHHLYDRRTASGLAPYSRIHHCAEMASDA